MYLNTNNNNNNNKSRVLHFYLLSDTLVFLGTGPISRKGVEDGS